LFVQDRTHLAALSYTLGKVGDGRLSEQQQGLVGRLAWLAYEDSDAAVLLDADASYVLKLPDSAAGRVTRLTIQPEFTVGNLRLVDTGPIEASHIAEWQFESVAAWRNLYAQAGYFRYRVTRRASLLPDPDFEGWYGLMTWVLTGERRSYDPSTASFRAPRPQSPLSGGTGVWELALRYSAIDLEDDGAPAIAFGDAIHGGRQNVRNFAINWYPTRHLHLALTHEWIEVKRFAGNGSGLGGSSSATMLRSQIAF
jgi:phosphate-selective porin OprO/OprP